MSLQGHSLYFLSFVAAGSNTWRKANVTPNFKKGNRQPATSEFHLNSCEGDGTMNP